MMKAKKNILVVAAHPDDEVLGCGGSLLKFKKEGFKINTIFLSSGVGARKSKNLEKDIAIRKKSAIAANKIIGSKILTFLNYSDNQFDRTPFLHIVKNLEEIIFKIKPSIIFTHSNTDLNIDHEITSRAVVTASRPFTNSFLKTLLSFEIPSSTEFNFSNRENKFKPNFFVDITKTLKFKINALKKYSTEIRKYPHPLSLTHIKNLSKVRGSNIGVKAAEAFELLRHLR